MLLPELVRRVPHYEGNYFEPFIGAGALFFELEPGSGHINDCNSALINLYNVIKLYPNELEKDLKILQDEFNSSQDKSNYYYKKRELYNSLVGKNSVFEAALFVLLNRTNYNGLYRVNSQGKFNVPFGKRKSANLMIDRIAEISRLLQNTMISNVDFEKACENVQAGDFVYFDPPYYNTFVDYKKDGFSKEDQVRLFNLFQSLDQRGAYCMLSNSDHVFIRRLYENYTVNTVNVKRLINRDANNRDSTEIIVTNYEINND